MSGPAGAIFLVFCLRKLLRDRKGVGACGLRLCHNEINVALYLGPLGCRQPCEPLSVELQLRLCVLIVQKTGGRSADGLCQRCDNAYLCVHIARQHARDGTLRNTGSVGQFRLRINGSIPAHLSPNVVRQYFPERFPVHAVNIAEYGYPMRDNCWQVST